MWTFLIVGSFAAVGAAMALGTGAALLRYYRTGSFPDQQGSGDMTTGRLVSLYVRIIVGAVLAVYGIASLASAGLL